MLRALYEYLKKNHPMLSNVIKMNMVALHHCLISVKIPMRGYFFSNYFRTHQIKKLHIGSGRNVLTGWLNTDLRPYKGVVFLDAAKKFPFNNDVFDYIFCEHLIEHLNIQEGIKLIQEIYRTLKAGGKLRISTPNLRLLIDLYGKNKTDLQERYIRFAVNSFSSDLKIYSDTFTINYFFRDWGHKFIYDYRLLKDLLEKAGFINISEYEPGKSADVNLQGIESHGRSITEEFNKLESMVIGGTKP